MPRRNTPTHRSRYHVRGTGLRSAAKPDSPDRYFDRLAADLVRRGLASPAILGGSQSRYPIQETTS